MVLMLEAILNGIQEVLMCAAAAVVLMYGVILWDLRDHFRA